VSRNLRGPVQGAALVLYLVLVPLLEVRRWPTTSALARPWLVRAPLVALGLIWLAITVALVVSVLQRRRDDGVTTNGLAWLAGVLVALVSSTSAPAGAAPPVHATTISAPHHEPVQADGAFHLLPLLLMARVRRDRRAEQPELADEEALDDVIAAEAGIDLSPLRSLHHFLAGAPAGLAAIPDDFDAFPEVDDDDPVVVCRVRTEPGQTIVGYARVGTTLPLPNPLSANQLRDELVGLPNERLSFASTEAELLRALALRDNRTLVVFTGDSSTIDEELKQRCVCVNSGAAETQTPVGVEVRLLQSTPVVLGLIEPFAPTLRRRCIEMVSYLAMHDDPVTGDRLRSRVLVHADVEASKGTLLNTATAVRRSLGSDDRGPRLHPVSSAGLYSCHGVTSDIATFHDEVRRGRRAEGDRAVTHYRRALGLISSEPLASTTKGFDWFVLEGHLASLQRDGEWAALTLYEYYCAQGDFDEAFWALRQGLLLDPTNDLLREALYQAPRLRQFGRDGAGAAQDEAVGTRSAVAMSWSLERFRR